MQEEKTGLFVADIMRKQSEKEKDNIDVLSDKMPKQIAPAPRVYASLFMVRISERIEKERQAKR